MFREWYNQHLHDARCANAFSVFSQWQCVVLSVLEYEKRLAVFTENLDKIAAIQEKEQGTATYGVTEFADISSKSKIVQTHG